MTLATLKSRMAHIAAFEAVDDYVEADNPVRFIDAFVQALCGDAAGIGAKRRAQMSLTDPDSRAMAAHAKVAVGYNVQVAVDAKHKLIVEQPVTNQVVDMGLLTQTVFLHHESASIKSRGYAVQKSGA